MLTLIPAILGMLLLNGMPKLETYHQPAALAQLRASTNSTVATTAMRLRLQRNTCGDTSTVANAATAAPRAAKSPKWCTHLVGANIRKKMVPKTTPSTRQAGPRATPGTRLRRRRMNIAMNRHAAISRKPKRRDTEPSTVGRNM
ncbi:Uncharacterised protein [Mycobacteroides abscessus subsp. abscessus]|nr:Uncharacterised protein [Mycobacteroides abscessus subsp. abscessus]SIN44475.1 Uncharacterised protein [Mycobacteroides abscessus subsp. bolletii]SKM05325.1 Uncharacterised protein [Mycobacteroides abscessus subsp. massiliense]SKM95553.1 Uncharacterised protein [Mycobacteroides abscessus subsp. massiliense]SKN60087.1 Uncharacterised protein [Mycobacteroides abscessus subsp. massiliense]